MIVFHFAAATLHDGTPLPQAGEELPVRTARLCLSGWHGCFRAIDALGYALGCKVALRELHGVVVTGKGNVCASRCRMLTGYHDASDLLRDFTIWCAARAAQHAKGSAAAAEWATRAANRADEVRGGSRRDRCARIAWAAVRAAHADLLAARDVSIAAEPRAGWTIPTAAERIAAERTAQNAWLEPRLRALLGQEERE